MNIFERVAARGDAKPDPTGRYRLDNLDITEVAFTGAGILDQSSSKAMVADVWKGLPDHPERRAAFIRDFGTNKITETVSKAPPAPAPGHLAGSYILPSAGICMTPVIFDGEPIELDPAAAIAPGDICALVSRFAFFPMVGQYLGRRAFEEVPPFYQDAPETFHVFLKREPLTLVAVADADLVTMHRVTAIGTGKDRREPLEWAFDVRRHRDLAETFAIADGTPYQPSERRDVSAVCFDEVRAFFTRLEEIALKERANEAS